MIRVQAKQNREFYIFRKSEAKNASYQPWSFPQGPVQFLAHLSRRLTGELIGYPWIRRPSSSSVRPFTFSNISSETTWPIKAKFYVKPLWEGGKKDCINGPGHMTKMVATPIYGKNLKKSSSPEPAGRFPRNLVCSIGDSYPS